MPGGIHRATPRLASSEATARVSSSLPSGETVRSLKDSTCYLRSGAFLSMAALAPVAPSVAPPHTAFPIDFQLWPGSETICTPTGLPAESPMGTAVAGNSSAFLTSNFRCSLLCLL